MTEFIDDTLYQTIKKVMPIFCVDLVAHRGNAVLLCKRLNEPIKGEWYFPGGRLHKNENISSAIARIAWNELGITVRVEKELGFHNVILDGAHTPGIAMLVRPLNLEIVLDGQHSEYKFVGKNETGAMNLSSYIVQVLSDSKVFEEEL